MGERKLLSEDLVVRREWADCGWCEKPRHKCVCDAARAITSYGTPTPADIAAHLLATEAGPKPWRDGDERCHCTHCDWCGRLYRTADIWRHREVCPVVAVAHAMAEALHAAEVPRVG